ncbi:MAG: monovalent cation:proton antiporter-2 (CPA2) family protein [Pseudomonadota bacterium]
MAGFLLQATIYLAAAVIAVPIAKQLGLGSVLGYLIAGLLIGPILGLVGSETQDLQHFAEFGVVMMLFLIGLELDPKALWDMRAKLLGLGGMQVAGTTIAIMAVAMFIGQSWTIALAIGMTLALSSTAIVVQTLNEKGLMATPGGRSAFSVLLAQDIAVIPMLAILPLLALSTIHNGSGGHGGDDHGGHGGGHATMSLVEGLPGWGVTLVTVASIGIIIFAGLYLTRPVFKFIARSALREMFTALALLMVVGIALLMTLVGLSPALGTFLAGVVLANSEFRHELESDIEPFKGLLLGLFFITVGAGMDLVLLWDQFGAIAAMTLGVILIKGAILYILALVFKLPGREKRLFTLSLAQAGEFGFVMVATAIASNAMPRDTAQLLQIIIALSMFLTPLLFIFGEMFEKWWTKSSDADDRSEDEIDDAGPVIIVGMGRVGQIINRMALAAGTKTVVIDNHVDHIDTMRKFGVKGYFGDPTRPELMHTAGLMEAQVLVVAVDDRDAAVRLTEIARKARPDLPIIARAYGRNDVYRLYAAGATDIVRETFDSAVRMSRYMLGHLGWGTYEADMAAEEFTKADRGALFELAQLWDPELDVFDNSAYVERAKEINQRFNTGFLANLAGIVDRDVEDETEDDAAEKPTS